MSQPFLIQSFWSHVIGELRKLFPRDTFKIWFEPLRCLEVGDQSVVVGAPNEFAAIFIEDNYLDLISQKVELASGRQLKVFIRVYGEPREEPPRERGVAVSAPGEAPSRVVSDRVKARLKARRDRLSAQLNPSNSFENFVVGSENQLAHAACMAVGKTPGVAYNPLFIYGDTGLGKTHLMHAVAHSVLDLYADKEVAYVSCEKFTNDYIHAIKENATVEFRRFYRNIDVLLIDDVHFLTGKERIQEEFFHTFNELFESQRQICLSSDRPASEISRLESRLVSRFQWGMVTDIHPPDFETRLAIIRKKAEGLSFNLPDEILQFLAQKITRNVRRMEGALTRVASYHELMKRKLDLATVENLLQDVLQEEAQNQITVDKIQRKICEYYDLRMSDMVSRRRPSNIAFPRQVAMCLTRLLTNHSLQEIGESFGGRDHGTVIHACKTVENMMEQDESVKHSVEYLTKQLSNQNP